MGLVHYGFSREEAFWMPIPEMMDYIKLINEDNEREMQEIEAKENEMKSKTNMRGMNYAGNTVPGFV